MLNSFLGGMLLLELNRLLRPGGYFIWSATPVYQKLEEDVEIWKGMSFTFEKITNSRFNSHWHPVMFFQKWPHWRSPSVGTLWPSTRMNWIRLVPPFIANPHPTDATTKGRKVNLHCARMMMIQMLPG